MHQMTRTEKPEQVIFEGKVLKISPKELELYGSLNPALISHFLD